MNYEFYHNYEIAKVVDELGRERTVDYDDNIYEILSIENVIELVEGEIIKLQKWLNNHQPDNKNNLWINLMPVYMPAIAGGVCYLVSPLVVGDDNNLKSLFIICGTAGIVMVSSLYTLVSNLGNSVNIKEYKGKQAELYAMEDILKGAKEKLQDLNNTKNVSKNNSSNLNDIKRELLRPDIALDWLKHYKSLFNMLGSNENRYMRYYNKGILENKLSKRYDEKDISLAKDYFEGRAKMLSKKKDRKI